MDYHTIQTYTNMVDFLGKLLGPHYEIALHDTSDPIHSVLAIANGHVTGREPGAPLTTVMVQLIAEGHYKKENHYLHYSGSHPGIDNLRSSIFYLKDAAGNLEGLLCINFDDSSYKEVSARIMRLCHPDYFFTSGSSGSPLYPSASADGSAAEGTETAAPGIEELLAQMANDYHMPLDKLNMNEKMKILKSLKDKGAFNIKGAVQAAADCFDCSASSVYRYLSKV